MAAIQITDNCEIMLRSSNNRALIFDTALLLPKTTKSTIGVQVMSLKGKAEIINAKTIDPETAEGLKRFRCKAVPSTGSPAKELPDPDQLTL